MQMLRQFYYIDKNHQEILYFGITSAVIWRQIDLSAVYFFPIPTFFLPK
jgi:hypothetical protein